MTALIVSGVILAILIFMVISIYNGLVTLKNRYENSFAQIKVQLKRRHDLIPNLVETAKKYMDHEKSTLEAVIEARNAAHKAADDAEANPGNAETMSLLAGAEKLLKQNMGQFFALAENYPDLKANTTMNGLMEELTATENKIAFARQAYNDAVMNYNTKCQVFPANTIAGAFNFKEAALLDIDETEAEAVKVKF